MQILIVHRDVEIGAQLGQMIKAYTAYECELMRTGADALAWAETHPRCDFLLTQLEASGIDGFALGGGLSERFPRLQTAFFPAYRASEQRLEIRDTKIFPEPIDGERLLEMIHQANASPARTGDLFHPADILQMCCLSRKGGALQLVSAGRSGLVFLRNGKITYAEAEGLRGPAALLEIIAWEDVEFAHDSSVRPAAETISEPWDKVLIEAVKGRKRQVGAPASGPPIPASKRPTRRWWR
jgi:CheY-like chemotaxis protein